MNQYMVSMDLPSLSEIFIQLIPSQRARVAELMAEGKLLSYTLALDRTKLWITAAADSENSVREMLASLPLTKFMKVTVQQLAFNEVRSMTLPKFSLN
jgi:muconolactone delta-isomerase